MPLLYVPLRKKTLNYDISVTIRHILISETLKYEKCVSYINEKIKELPNGGKMGGREGESRDKQYNKNFENDKQYKY